MVNNERIELILNALNIADNYSFLSPVSETDLYLQNSYSKILGEEALRESLSMNFDPKYHLSRWDTLLQDEIANQNLSNKDAFDIIKRIEKETSRNWRIIYLIRRSAELGDIRFAESLVTELPDNNEYSACQYVAQRIILKYLIKNIDFKEFKDRIKLCKPVKMPKNEIMDLKKSFIEEIAQREGWKKAYEISKDKLFGTTYYPNTLYHETKRISITEMEKLIDDNFESSDENYLKARVFVKYAYFNSPLFPDEDLFEIIFKKVEEIDSSYKENGNRLKDMLAYNLGCSTNKLPLIKRCKKIISNPMHKRELSYHEENIKK